MVDSIVCRTTYLDKKYNAPVLVCECGEELSGPRAALAELLAIRSDMRAKWTADLQSQLFRLLRVVLKENKQ